MRPYIPLLFLSPCKYIYSLEIPVSQHKVPFVIDEPLGPKSNGPLHLDTFANMQYKISPGTPEKPVQLNLEWQYESSTVKNDIRSVNHTQIERYSTLRFIFETYNHDGWVIFG